MSRVFAIVVTYNAMPWIDQCFGSLLSGTCPVDVLVVDNGSSDATIQTLRTRFAGVQVIEAGRNLGFGQANNLGMDLALRQGADYLLLLNQDAWLFPDTVEKLVDSLEAMPDTWIISPLQMDAGGKQPDLYFKRYLEEAGYAWTNSIDTPPNLRERYLDTPFVNAAAWLLPAWVIQRAGGFDPLFFHYGEDRHFAARVRHAGGHIRVDTQAMACHDRLARISAEGLTPAPTLHREWVHFLAQACDPALAAPRWFSIKRGARHLLHAGYHAARGNGRQARLEGTLGSRIVFNLHRVIAARRRSRQALLTIPHITSGISAGQEVPSQG
jgi:GT2 family glycosyltransferase